MKKILSICVPSYNMEQYLSRCIDSLLLVRDILDDLEIIIVNDGSKDSTLSIANSYKEKYPQSIVVVDKSNGHYGSTVNAAIKVATGKYFRILDADDWFDTEALIIFVNKLKEINVDCVFTRYAIHDYKRNVVEFDKTVEIPFNTILDLNTYLLPDKYLCMHQLCFKLEMLKRIEYRQSEGICYTDTEYVYFGLIHSLTLYALDITLYQYFIGRDDQSVSFISLKNNLHHRWIIIKRLIEDKSYLMGNLNSNNIKNNILFSLFSVILSCNLLYSFYNKDKDETMYEIMMLFKRDNISLYKKLIALKVKKIPYVKMWLNIRFFYYIIFTPIRILKMYF